MSQSLENPNTILRDSSGNELATSANPLQVGGELYSGYQPAPVGNTQVGLSEAAYDASGRLEIHGAVSCDETSFRDDFSGSSLNTTPAGTMTFTNGSTAVTGVGTTFSTAIEVGDYVRRSADTNTAWALVEAVNSDTSLTLAANYTGTSGTGGISSNWFQTLGTGGSLTVATSTVTLAAGTTASSNSNIFRAGDYGPYTSRWYFSLSQRIANNTFRLGLMDTQTLTPNKAACFEFTGTTNTSVNCVSAFSSAAADVQTTAVTLPNGGTTATAREYKVDVSANQVTFSIDGVIVARHNLHIPGPYDWMNPTLLSVNGGSAPASSTNAVLDYIYFQNVDRLQIDDDFNGEPIGVKEQFSSSAATTSVAAAVADTSLLAANQSRLGTVIFNDSGATLYLKYGTGASTTSFTYKLPPYSTFEMPAQRYTGAINGYWSAATGNARITELT
jgi:hypothetical protein